MKCLILAGGFATRLWPFTEKRAKPLLPIAGKALLTHTLERLPMGMPIIISTNQAYARDFENWAKDFPERKIDIFIEDAHSDDAKPGALAGVSLAIRKLNLDSNILLIAGDNYFGFDLAKFTGKYENKPLIACYDIQDLNEAKKFGVVVEKWGKVIEFQEKPENPKSTLVSAGCYVLPAGLLPKVVEYAREYADNLGGLFEYFLRQGEVVQTFSFTEPWFDIGSFGAYLEAHKLLVGENQIIGENFSRDNSQLSGAIVIGDNVKLSDCEIVDSVILDNCELHDCVIKNSVIDQNCKLRGLDLDHKILRENVRIEI